MKKWLLSHFHHEDSASRTYPSQNQTIVKVGRCARFLRVDADQLQVLPQHLQQVVQVEVYIYNANDQEPGGELAEEGRGEERKPYIYLPYDQIEQEAVREAFGKTRGKRKAFATVMDVCFFFRLFSVTHT